MRIGKRWRFLSRTRVYRLLLGAFLVATIIWLFPADPDGFAAGSIRRWRRSHAPHMLVERQRAFWRAFLTHLEATAPGCPPPKQDGELEAINFDWKDSLRSPPDLLQMTADDVLKARDAHSEFVDKARDSNALKPVFVPRTRGVVYTAGGAYLPVLVISLRMLRRSGSKLPAELFLKDWSEYEDNICDDVLPSLNARCVVLSDIVDPASGSPPSSFSSSTTSEDTRKVEISHFQLKIFAILFSSFEEIVWIDADCFPLHPPEKLLDDEPFKSTGMVTWPDHWASTASNKYYLISQQPVPPISLRASSETGEILLSKSSHPLTLLLTTYYNYYGPSHYYRLLSQGGPGEGDKETFVQAALAVGEEFYSVAEGVKPIGHRHKDGGLSGSAMVQFDPVQDYHNQRALERSTSSNKVKGQTKDSKEVVPPRVFFLHAHYPKYNPATVFDDTSRRPVYAPDGETYSRAWLAPGDVVERFGYDVERKFWEEIRWVSCHLENSFRAWADKKGICDRVNTYWKDVFGK